MKSILKNQTGIEMWIIEKAMYRRMYYPELDEFVYPYDLGYKENLKQVFNNENVAKGMGIEWPVIEGCDQYTLTVSKHRSVCTNRNNAIKIPHYS